MKKLLSLLIVVCSLFSLPAYCISAYQTNNGTFCDDLSGMILPLSQTIQLLPEESDLNEESGGRWMLFSDGSQNDIALIIYPLERPLSAEEFFFDYLLKEMDEAPSSDIHILFGKPSMQRFVKQDHVIAKIQYHLMSSNVDFLNSDYFFTHGKWGFKIWLSSNLGDLESLEKLEAQIEHALDHMEFKK